MDTLGLPFQFKSIDDAGHIEGLAAAFGNVDHGGDVVVAGAFTKTLLERGGAPLPMLLHHDKKRPVGVWTEFRETAAGLDAKGRLTLATRDAQEAHALARDGALTGLSIGYVPRDHIIVGKARHLRDVALHEASLVTFPMNDLARVRSVKAIVSVRDLEDLLHDEGGLSNRQAKAAANAAWKAIHDQPDESAATAELAALFSKSAARIAAR